MTDVVRLVCGGLVVSRSNGRWAVHCSGCKNVRRDLKLEKQRNIWKQAC